MRRVLVIGALLVLVGLAIALPAAGDDGDGDYKVRAYFDNAAFVAPAEDVRVAGVTVGSIDSIDVTTGDEVTSEDGAALPGKAIVVLKIDDDGFKDFREDASCRIRPQSLLGEKYVDCVPTQPHAPGAELPPELDVIEDGPGEGERLLPVESNGTSVDLDLFQNINRYSYRERFRLILNELGAGVAGRGEDLGEVIDRANPALKQTDRVLKILADQNRQLASLATDGDTVLEPLAREREHITGFMANAQIAGAATAERKPELEAQLRKLPGFLRELRKTMKDLRGVTDNATPVFADLGPAAKPLARATRNLGPLARRATPALTTLGDAGEQAGPKLVAADDLTVDLTRAARRAAPVSQNLEGILTTFQQTGGIKNLLDFIRFSTASISGFDSFGHFLRTNVLVTVCIFVQFDQSATNCVAQWGRAPSGTPVPDTFAQRTGQAQDAGQTHEAGSSPREQRPPAEAEEIPELIPPPDTATEPDSEEEGDQPLEPEQGSTIESAEGRAAQAAAPGLGSSAFRPFDPTRPTGALALDLDSTSALLHFLLGAS